MNDEHNHDTSDAPGSDDPTLEQSAAMLGAQSSVKPRDISMLGRTIGHFTIKRLIGEGGMGAVYEAQQETPRRIVAFKMIRAGITSRSALRRFQYEVQTLARLRHVGIAQIYEAGTTDASEGSLPWFAMEYLAGAKTLTQFSTEKALSIQERLLLFARICDAAHHGHQKGIIHRDLKPGNILVTRNGDPKIIDFGVARSTDSDLSVTTVQTDVGAIIGTLQYMSPEQCATDPHDIDIRSDVYALGVVLFELLTGRRPYDISNRAIYEAARIVREDPPTKPSTIDRVLRGDIETICLKALEKDRDRRYQSAVEFRQDIDRYLAGDPITARRATLSYQLKLLYRRHRAPFVLSAILMVLLVCGVVSLSLLATTQAAALSEMDRQAARSQAIINGVTKMLEPDPAIASTWPSSVLFATVLEHATKQLNAYLPDVDSAQEAIESSYFALVLANSFLSIGDSDAARLLVDSATDNLSNWFPPNDANLLDAQVMDIVVIFEQGRVTHAMRMGRELVQAKSSHLGRHYVDTLATAWMIADRIARLGHGDTATQLIGELVQDMSYPQIIATTESTDAVYFLAETTTTTVPTSLMMIIDRIAPEGEVGLGRGPVNLVNNLAWELGSSGGHPEAALGLLERVRPAVDSLPTNAESRRFNRIYRGEMLRHLGRHVQSVILLERQVELDATDSTVSMGRRRYAKEKLAQTYEAMGRTSEAAMLREGK